MSWLPEGKTAALCFSVDDVHPATFHDPYEAGGGLSRGGLGYVERLLERHRSLKATLFVTPAWRPVQLVRSRPAARLPVIGNHLYHVALHAPAHFSVDRFPDFVRYLNGLPRVEVAPHGLHHVHRGPLLAVEFQKQSREVCREMLSRGLAIFEAAGLNHTSGFSPPGWNLPAPLVSALGDLGFKFVASARDIRTPIAPAARAQMSGLQGVSLLRPERICGGRLVHIPTNFQATSKPARAHAIIACNGLLSIKAHVFKRGGGHTLADGLDDDYFGFLDDLMTRLERCYGPRLWWTSMNEIAARVRASTSFPLSSVG